MLNMSLLTGLRIAFTPGSINISPLRGSILRESRKAGIEMEIKS